MRFFGRKDGSQRGVAVVELAITIPVLTFLLFGIIQWGYIFGAYITVRNAAMTGIRRYSIVNGSVGTATDAAKNALTPLLNPNDTTACATSGSTPCVQFAQAFDAGGGAIGNACTVNYNLRLFFSWVVPSSTAGRIMLSARATMAS